jgi:type IV fimbrial biogenesis protein FimT
MARQDGLTLLELLTALAIAAMLATLAVPALDTVRLNAHRAAAMNDLLRAAWFARSEALRRGEPVVLCAAGGNGGCAAEGAAWRSGWLVRPLDSRDAPLRRGAAVATPRAAVRSNRVAFVFQPGDRRSTNGTLAWCDDRGASSARALVIAPTGRPRVQQGAGSLECPPG